MAAGLYEELFTAVVSLINRYMDALQTVSTPSVICLHDRTGCPVCDVDPCRFTFLYIKLHLRLCVFCGQGSEQPAADVGLCDGGGHAGSEEPETLCGGSRSQLVRALSQLPAGEAAGALPRTHLHAHAGEIHTGNGAE